MNEVSQKYEADRVEDIREARNLVNNMPEDFEPIAFQDAYDSASELIEDLDHPMKLLFTDIHKRIGNLNDYISNIKDPEFRKKGTQIAAIFGLALGSAGCTARTVNNNTEINTPTPISQSIGTDNVIGSDPGEVVTEEYTATPTITETKEPTSTQTKTEEPTPTETATRIPMSNDVEERGFIFDVFAGGGNEVEGGFLFFPKDVRIEDYKIVGDEIVVTVVMNLYGREMTEEISGESLEFASIEDSPDGKINLTETMEFITKDSDLSKYFSKDGKYWLLLSLDEPVDITEEDINNYVNGDIDLDFIPYSIIRDNR
jgi:hypothetical protein